MKILLVEDSVASALVLNQRLSHFGYTVVLAKNGAQAVEKFRTAAPDLVLMDIEMPLMNGFEAATRIRAVEATQQWAWTPIIFLTASDTVANLITAIEAGGDDFMAKSTPEPVLQAKMKAMTRIAALRHDLSQANHKLEQLANSDGLTGLCNRRHMDTLVDTYFAQAQAAGAPFGLLMIDIDNFKKYNDHYGHLQGDDCLRQVASAIAAGVAAFQAEGLPLEAFAARYGGEEFAVILPSVPAPLYERLAQALPQAVQALHLPHDKNADYGCVTISLGGCHQTQASGRLFELFRTADANLYRAKEGGRNRAVVA